MKLLTLVLLLIPAGPDRNDLEFRNSVERFVMDASPHARIPEPCRHQIEDLGNECWQYRDGATKRLERQIGSQTRWLFWGRRAGDLEIRMRCHALLRQLYRCPLCYGAGECLNFKPIEVMKDGWSTVRCGSCGQFETAHGGQYRQACRMCGGDGTRWARGAFE